jgi:hypothetical protein
MLKTMKLLNAMADFKKLKLNFYPLIIDPIDEFMFKKFVNTPAVFLIPE